MNRLYFINYVGRRLEQPDRRSNFQANGIYYGNRFLIILLFIPAGPPRDLLEKQLREWLRARVAVMRADRFFLEEANIYLEQAVNIFDGR